MTSVLVFDFKYGAITQLHNIRKSKCNCTQQFLVSAGVIIILQVHFTIHYLNVRVFFASKLISNYSCKAFATVGQFIRPS